LAQFVAQCAFNSRADGRAAGERVRFRREEDGVVSKTGRLAGALTAAVATAALAIAALAIATQAGAAAASAQPASFAVGAGVESFTPPAAGTLLNDPADCLAPADALFTGARPFAFSEPYRDQQGSGHFDLGDPFVDCNQNGRWDGNFLGGGSNTPRYYNHVADPVGARAIVVSNGSRTIAIEVVDQEGLFNVYADRIRAKVAADGYLLDGAYISATHDESAPDSLGLGGPSSLSSGVNQYFADYMVGQSAKAIEDAYNARRSATIRYAEATEPANLRQCWSSYPFIDNPLMPALQAVDSNGATIATLASVSQHAETLGFNPDPAQADWVSSDWPHFFRTALEQRYGGVAIEMAGSVGSVETPQVFGSPLSRTPQRFIDASHPAGCRTLFDANGSPAPVGYATETTQLGQTLAGAVAQALDGSATASRSGAIWGETRDVCLPVDNVLFKAAAIGGVFAQRPAYAPGCKVAVPALPTGQTVGTSVKTEVAAFRVGDGSFIALPGEVFPFTYLRGPVGPEDMNYPQYAMPPWPMPYLHTRYRFFDGLANDMIGYVFPRGNDAGVPGDHPLKNPTASGTDRFSCGHSDDSEAVSAKAADKLGVALVKILAAHAAHPEDVQRGRYVLGDGTLSRNPEGSTDTIKCSGAHTVFGAGAGPAVAVWLPQAGLVRPAHWMSLSGGAQSVPDRDTRGWIDPHGARHWLDVFPAIAGAPARVIP
jgi:hypothetical protein